MNSIKLFSLFLLLIVKTQNILAQDIILFCASDKFVNQSLKNHPEKQLIQDQLEIFTQQATQNEKQIYTIPVVFHIIHENGSENISDAQILDEMRVINEDFSLNNADAANIVSAFVGIAGNVGFVFKLANKDPQGNCTNGIDRIISTETFVGDDDSKLNAWPNNMYLNVWVVRNIDGAAAYAYLPGTAPSGSVDGVIIRSDYVGSIGTSSFSKSHTLTHEVGHFFNLKHPWGNTNTPGVSCGNDNVNDTPTTEGWTSCSLSGATCGSAIDNVQNFMDYSYCSCMFTAGQKTRMISSLTSIWGGRNNLYTSSNLVATGVSGTPLLCSPNADFSASTAFICAGSSIQFSDISTNGSVANRTWTVNGGIASSYSDSVITVTYNTPGTYNVSLSVSNASGTDAITKNSVISVLSTTAMYGNGYIEDFENDVIPEADWNNLNAGTGFGFSISNLSHFTGVKSLAFFNSVNYADGVYNVVGPTLDLTVIGNSILTFHLAYAQRTSTDGDKLRLMISTDCGKTWIQSFIKLGAGLKTVTNPVSGSFIPSSQSEWRTETVYLTNYATNTNLRIKFEFTSRGGNNLFIDDINLGGYTFADIPLSNSSFLLFPNPADNEISIQTFDGNVPENIIVTDAAGKTIQQLPPFQSTTVLNLQSFVSGIYFIKVKLIDGSFLVRKFVKI